ncbi:MAG: hypothetical protein IPQ07_16370 [Myxococcales bacterium]|nr:hypothetical protein [Myxococcales bacterium]
MELANTYAIRRDPQRAAAARTWGRSWRTEASATFARRVGVHASTSSGPGVNAGRIPSAVVNGNSWYAALGENASAPAKARSNTVALSVPRQLAIAAPVMAWPSFT